MATTTLNFNSIHELVQYTQQPRISGADRASDSTYNNDWTKTKSFQESTDLLLNGYDVDIDTIKLPNYSHVDQDLRQTSTYKPYGATPSVARHLTGNPNSMIHYKKTPQKTPVISIYKNISFSAFVSATSIIEWGRQAVQVVQAIEAKGIRVNLYVTMLTEYNQDKLVVNTRIKGAGERLSLRKMAYPMVHPSFLRRQMFRVMENTKEATAMTNHSYGRPILDNIETYFPKNSIILPNRNIDVAAVVTSGLKNI